MNTAMRMTASAARLLLLCGCASVLLTGPGSAQQSSVVTYPTSVAVSSPLSSAPPASAAPTTGQRPLEIPLHALPQGQTVPGADHASDRAAQTNAAHVLEAQPQANFGGISQDGLIPPDPNIAVSETYIVEMVNSELAVYDKAGNLQPGYPKTLSNLWTGLGGACGNSGDPVVQYDRLATTASNPTPGRWFISQLQSLNSPYGECIAVSTSNDPGGTYNLYFYSFGSNLNDYPKFGVWPTAANDAYLATYNLFANGSNFVGADLCAYDREAMLNGLSAAQVCTQLSTSAGGFLPSDLDGPTAPLAGEPGYFLAYNASTLNSLTLYTIAPNFGANPPTAPLGPVVEIPVAGFSPACGGGTCIPQPSTNKKLDSLGDRLMYRLAYQNFGAHQSMVVNHSVVSGSSVGPRWYLLDKSGGQFDATSLAQSGTWVPDSAYRWMGSIAMDQSGDILLGYSRSSSTSYPSIVVAGRTPSDPLGQLEAETVLKAGGGSQTMYSRWGDYTAMRIDPADNCTFWYVNEYLSQTSFGNWNTYIGSYKFNTCGGSGGGSGDFALSETPSPITLIAGASESTSTVTVSPINGFSSAVTLSSGCAAPITCSFSPNPVTGGSGASTMTVSVAGGAPSGSTTETITATDGGSLTHQTTFTVTVPAQFTLSAAQSSLTVNRGSSNSTTITSADTSGSFNSNVNLAISTSLPARASASLSATTISSVGGKATLLVKANRNAPTGKYQVTVSGNDGYTAQTTVNVTIQ